MQRPFLPALLIALIWGCGTPAPQGPGPNPGSPANADSSATNGKGAPSTGYRILARDPAVLAFDEGDTLHTDLSDVREMTRITTPLGRTWFLFQGRRAKSPSREVSLYVLSPGDSTDAQALEQPWHMPGRLIDTTGQTAFYEADVFAGQVLRDTVGVIWYDRSLMPDGQWKLNTILLNLNGPRPDTLVFFGHGRRTTTLQLAFHGQCRMLEGLDQQLR